MEDFIVKIKKRLDIKLSMLIVHVLE